MILVKNTNISIITLILHISYRELKEKCRNGIKEIEDGIICIKSARKISSCEEKNNNGIKSVVCELSISDTTTPLYQHRM